MRKIFLLLTFFLSSFLLFSVSGNTLAQEGKAGLGTESIVAPDYYPVPQPEPGFLGQDHNYTVVFRGNGEAVVSAKIVLTNKGDSSLSDVKLRIPRVDPREVSAYQVIKQKTCIRYEPQVYDPLTRSYRPQICSEYQEPDYYNSYYGDAKYQKAKTEQDIDTLKITLPQGLAPGKSGSFFVYFRGLGYAKKNIFGAYNYTFDTLKAEDSIRNLTIGISTDSDLFLKGVKGEVNYRFEDSAMQMAPSGMAAPEKSVALDSYVNQIGQGSITKKASNLAPLESYTVNGSYAKSRLRLYGKEIFYTLLGIIVFFGLLALLLRFAFKKLGRISTANTTSQKKSEQGPTGFSLRMLFLTLGTSFLTSIVVIIYTFFVYFVGNYLDNVVGYQYQAFFIIILLIISFVFYALLVFAPAIYIGVKKGVGWGIATLVFSVFWLIIEFTVAFLILVLLFGIGSGNYGPNLPYL